MRTSTAPLATGHLPGSQIARLQTQLREMADQRDADARAWADANTALMAERDTARRELALVTAERDRALELLAGEA